MDESLAGMDQNNNGSFSEVWLTAAEDKCVVNSLNAANSYMKYLIQMFVIQTMLIIMLFLHLTSFFSPLNTFKHVLFVLYFSVLLQKKALDPTSVW